MGCYNSATTSLYLKPIFINLQISNEQYLPPNFKFMLSKVFEKHYCTSHHLIWIDLFRNRFNEFLIFYPTEIRLLVIGIRTLQAPSFIGTHYTDTYSITGWARELIILLIELYDASNYFCIQSSYHIIDIKLQYHFWWLDCLGLTSVIVEIWNNTYCWLIVAYISGCKCNILL